MSEPEHDPNATAAQENQATQPMEAFHADFESSATLVGQLLDGRFLIDKDLTTSGADAGGFGLVYLARDMKLMGRETVVKILQKGALANPEITRKFQHEKEALIRLDHPNIVRILDSGVLTDGNPFMVMEYIRGHSLRRMIRENGRLDLDQAAHVTQAVTGALHAAHTQKILHRDIKPENIMLTPEEDGHDRVRVIDFGIARVGESKLAPETSIGQGIGTVRYIAPEQLVGNLDLTPGVDVYSFAIVAYEMITGSLPFQPRTVVEMFEMQKQGAQTPPSQLRPEIPPEVDEIVMSGLEFDIERRPRNIKVYGNDLANALRQTGGARTARHYDQAAPTVPAFRADDTTDGRRAAETRPNDATLPLPPVPDIKPEPRPKTMLWTLLGGGALAAAAVAGVLIWGFGFGGFGGASNVAPNANTAALSRPDDGRPVREIVYFLNVQKMRDGKPFETPFRSSGREIYEDGYKFSMAVQPEGDGYLYLFNEGKDDDGNKSYFLLYPTPSTNGGSASVAAGEEAETAMNTFGGGRGTEIVWLVWSKTSEKDLETVRESAFLTRGRLDEKASATLSAFLEKHKASVATAAKDPANPQMKISGKGDLVIHRIELEHQ
jgi:tRNA A-37 threonylcarbamoyl transferase component Bud32